MKITLKEVKKVFVDVLNGRMTREEADRWAYAVVHASESGNLVFSPKEDKKRIWDGIMYLYGIDMMENPNEYLHTEEDIRIAMKEKVGE